MTCTRPLSYTRSALLWAGVLTLGLVARPDHDGLPSPAARAEAPTPPRPPKADENQKARNATDLKELQQVFGNNPVTILASPGTVEGVRIIDVVTVFGKQYLRVQK